MKEDVRNGGDYRPFLLASSVPKVIENPLVFPRSFRSSSISLGEARMRQHFVNLGDNLSAGIQVKDIVPIAGFPQARFHVQPPASGRPYRAKPDEHCLLTDVVRAEAACISATGKLATTDRPAAWLDTSASGVVKQDGTSRAKADQRLRYFQISPVNLDDEVLVRIFGEQSRQLLDIRCPNPAGEIDLDSGKSSPDISVVGKQG
jgi:hypothetical protein